MSSKNLKQNMLIGAIIGGMMISTSVGVFAASTDQSNTTQNAQITSTEQGQRRNFDRRGKGGPGFFGTRQNIGERNILDSLVEEGLLTSEEAERFLEKQEAKRAEELETGLNALVEKEILTENQVKKIIELWEAEKESRAVEKEKLKSMSDEERKAYFEEHKLERTDIMSNLVDQEILTEEQVKEIRNLFPGFNGRKHPGFRRETQESVEE